MFLGATITFLDVVEVAAAVVEWVALVLGRDLEDVADELEDLHHHLVMIFLCTLLIFSKVPYTSLMVKIMCL